MACALDEFIGTYKRDLWRLVAYAARCSSTPPVMALDMFVPDLIAFTEQLARLIEEEQEAGRVEGE